MTKYIACGGASMPVRIVEAVTARVHDRPDYTLAEATQVAEWLNGNDQPLPTMNMQDFPGNPNRA